MGDGIWDSSRRDLFCALKTLNEIKYLMLLRNKFDIKRLIDRLIVQFVIHRIPPDQYRIRMPSSEINKVRSLCLR